jgi:hypothetical protein
MGRNVVKNRRIFVIIYFLIKIKNLEKKIYKDFYSINLNRTNKTKRTRKKHINEKKTKKSPDSNEMNFIFRKNKIYIK